MTKSRDVIYVSDGDSYQTIQDIFEKYNYSRLPISKNSKANSIYGIIYQKEFYEMLINDELDLKSIIVDPIIKNNKKYTNILDIKLVILLLSRSLNG
jgi:CBS domain containing-hemolysin-like protein